MGKLPVGYPTVLEALQNPDVPRIMFVRSPYARVLSAYMEKIEIRAQKGFVRCAFFRKAFTLGEAIGSHACLLEAIMRSMEHACDQCYSSRVFTPPYRLTL
jgi:hypothetical protein